MKDTLVVENALQSNRAPDSLKTGPGITGSHSEIQSKNTYRGHLQDHYMGQWSPRTLLVEGYLNRHRWILLLCCHHVLCVCTQPEKIPQILC